MIMIIGGHAQGKIEYAKEHYENADVHIVMLNETAEAVFSDKWSVDGTTLFDEVPETVIKSLREDKDLIIITDEVGCGLIPGEAYDRALRDYIGRIQIKLAKEAEEVIRVTCGIGTKIK